MTAALFLLQRASAAVLALAVAVHLATVVYAVSGGLTAGEILERTEGNAAYLAFYVVFVLAVAVHAPIGLRNVLREWLGLRGRGYDGALAVFALALFALGVRAVIALYLA
jgi:fumarate reductase subunit C